jgi:hypothetical protein
LKSEINIILKDLDNGKIDTEEALKKIKSIDTTPKKVRKAHKIKIHVIDEDTNIKIPGIPFWLINSMISLGFGLGNIASKFSENIDEDLKMVLDNINSRDVKKIINELKKHGSYNLVDIEDGENTKVLIKIL